MCVQNYMVRAAEDIKQLSDRRQAVVSVRVQIRNLEEDMVSLGGGCNSVPVSGGGNRQERRLIALISRKDNLLKRERALCDLIRRTEAALNALPEQSRTVLLTVYASDLPQGTAMRQLERELHISQATVYRIRDKALIRLATMLGYV